jgi:hypothetical protein
MEHLEEEDEKIQDFMNQMEIKTLLKLHPYDINPMADLPELFMIIREDFRKGLISRRERLWYSHKITETLDDYLKTLKTLNKLTKE